MPSCLSRKTNLCTAIRATQGQGLMPDGTSRFSLDGKKLHHYMGTSTFPISRCFPRSRSPDSRGRSLRQGLLYRLRRHDRHWGGAQHRQGRGWRHRVVFGLGGIGLNVIQGLRLAGADMIIGVDTNNGKKEWGDGSA